MIKAHSRSRARARAGGRPLLLVVLVALAAGSGLACDAAYQGFLSSVPEPETDPSAVAHVYLGIDGMSRQAFDLARARGAFSGWNTADLVTPFPGTSDYSWTRTLRAGSLGGYELQYFDPAANQMQADGLSGTLDHLLREGIVGTLPAYQRFDFLGDGATWQARSYLDPLATLPGTLDELFDVVAGRARTRRDILAYVVVADIASHTEGIEPAVSVLVEIDRRIRAFKAAQRRRYEFTVFSDHGNAHLPSTLVDANDILKATGVTPVDALGDGSELAGGAQPADAPRAVPVVHVRVSYVALHAEPRHVAEVAARTSRSPYVDLAVAPIDRATGWYGVWRQGERHAFQRQADGTIVVADPARWSWLGADLGPFLSPDGGQALLADRDALSATMDGGYPDIFYRVATAFTHPAARYPADVLLSMPDDVASIGFQVPGAGAIRANDGFHGSLSRRATLSVLATESDPLPPVLRSDDLADRFPALRGEGE